MKENFAFTSDLSTLAAKPDAKHTLNVTFPLSELSCHFNATLKRIDCPVPAVEIDLFKEDKGECEKSILVSPQYQPSEEDKVAGHKELSVDVKGNVSDTGNKVKWKVKGRNFYGKGVRDKQTGQKVKACTNKLGAITISKNVYSTKIKSQDKPKQEDLKIEAVHTNSLESQMHHRKLNNDCNFIVQTKNRHQTKKRKCSMDVTYGEKIWYMYTNLLSVHQSKEKGSTQNDGLQRKEKLLAKNNRRHRREKRSTYFKGQTAMRRMEQQSVSVKSTYDRKGKDTRSLKNRISNIRGQKMSFQEYHYKLKSRGSVRGNVAKTPRQTDEINCPNKWPTNVCNRSSQTQTEASVSQTNALVSLGHVEVCHQARVSSRHDNVSESEFGCKNLPFQKKNPSLTEFGKNFSIFQSIGNTMCRPGDLTARLQRKVQARRSLWRSNVEGNKSLETITPVSGSQLEVLNSERDIVSNQKSHPLSTKRLLQVSPMVKDKSVSDPYEFKVTPVKETIILCERSKKMKRKSLVAQKKHESKPQPRPKLCKSKEGSSSLLDLVQKKTEHFFLRNERDHNQKRIGPGGSYTSIYCDSQIPSEGVAFHSETISLDCFSNQEDSKDCKLAKSLPSHMQTPFSKEKAHMEEASIVNKVCSSLCTENSEKEKETNMINSCEITVPQKAEINFSALSSVTRCEQTTYAYQLLDDENEEGDDDFSRRISHWYTGTVDSVQLSVKNKG